MVVALLSPIVGAFADASGQRKRFLALGLGVDVISTALVGGTEDDSMHGAAGDDTIVGEALSVFQTRRIGSAFVTEDDRPVGLITMLRLLNRGAA